jgi:hypothetical protein
MIAIHNPRQIGKTLSERGEVPRDTIHTIKANAIEVDGRLEHRSSFASLMKQA